MSAVKKGGIKVFNVFIIFFTLSEFIISPFYNSESIDSFKERLRQSSSDFIFDNVVAEGMNVKIFSTGEDSESFALDNNFDGIKNYITEQSINSYKERLRQSSSDFNFDNVEGEDSPVIFIILDELSSSQEVYNYTKDSIDFNFDKKLNQIGFQTFSVFNSLSVKTTLSLPSIFNFNLHNSKETFLYEEDVFNGYSNRKLIYNKFTESYRKNALVDSLEKKGVKVTSYGHLSFDGHEKTLNNHLLNKATDQINMNIIDKVLATTLYGFIDKKIQGPEKPYWDINKDVLSKLSSISPDKNNFYFFHFYAPHWPFSYFDEHYEDESLGDLDNHVLFKRFFLTKLLGVLNDSKFNTSRIIITGDHGYRGDPIIDKTKTSLYIKGYDNIKDVNSFVVQDLGYLINSSF
ncbi:hypothetical protein N8131_07945 [Flavobacteriaceae bacterium]|nr:hypothetical protein [Flavobacteriaceae bacterium]